MKPEEQLSEQDIELLTEIRKLVMTLRNVNRRQADGILKRIFWDTEIKRLDAKAKREQEKQDRRREKRLKEGGTWPEDSQ